MSSWGRAVPLLGRIAVGAAVLAAALVPIPAKAANEALDVTPSTVEGRIVSSADPTYVQVRLKAGDQELTDITLSSFSNDGITATIEGGAPATVAQIPANAEHAWKLRLLPSKGTALAPAALNVQFTVAFKEGRDTLRQRFLFQAIKITAPRANEGTTLDVIPTTVDGRTVSSTEPINVEVRLKAAGEDLTDLTLSTFSNDGIDANIEGGASSASVAQLPANAEHAWQLRLVPTKDSVLAPAALSVNVRVAFKEGRELPRQRYLFQTMKITAPAATTVAALAEVDIKGSLEGLSHERPGRLFVIVTNKHSRSLRVTDVNINGPKFINVVGPGAKEFQNPALSEVPYGEAKVFPYEVTAPDQVVPGKYSVVVVVPLVTPDRLSGSVTKAQDIEVAILGESELLSKIGAPSLLFLPGVLFLLTWQLLWSYRKTAAERGEYIMTPTSSTFWTVAVVISLIAAFAYPWAVRWVFKEKRDYLVAYGLKDFMYVFGLTIVVAAVTFLLWRLGQWLATKIKAWLVFLNTPNEADSPINILKKLGRLRQSVVFRQAYQAARANDLILILEPWRQPAFIWLTPPARLEVKDDAPSDALNFVQLVANGEISNARLLAKRLAKGIKKMWWTLTWQTVGTVNHPTKGPATEWTEIAARARLIRVP